MTGNEIKILRKRMGWSQTQMGARLGLHRNTIGVWERKGPPDDVGAVLALVTGLQDEIDRLRGR